MRRTARFVRPIFVMRVLLVSTILLASACMANAQRPLPKYPTPRNGTLATLVREANLYANADDTAGPIATIQPGRELVVAERNGKWLRVFANTDPPDTRESDRPEITDESAAQPISGWMLDKGIIDVNTPHGDEILFGTADEAEQQAAVPDPPPHMAEEARLLYKRVSTMYPQSPWVPEAMYRAADIRWQLQKADAASLPSAHEKQNYLREQMDEDEMKKIEKYFPNTRWSDLAAFDLIDNKLCGDWQGSEKCPEQETNYYLQYVDQHPNSPKAAEALYDAIYRQAAAGDMWQSDADGKRADEDRGHAHAIFDRLQQKYPDSSFTARAASLLYKVDQGIPVYGSSRE
ncbi:MAG: outer membrane protein assembly factor BamD [Acidobacteriaceae bacterium]